MSKHILFNVEISRIILKHSLTPAVYFKPAQTIFVVVGGIM